MIEEVETAVGLWRHNGSQDQPVVIRVPGGRWRFAGGRHKFLDEVTIGHQAAGWSEVIGRSFQLTRRGHQAAGAATAAPATVGRKTQLAQGGQHLRRKHGWIAQSFRMASDAAALQRLAVG